MSKPQHKRPQPQASIRARLGWKITPELHRRIRRLWINHSKAEDRRDIDGLIATLAEDCIYEIVPTGRRWEGHDGARRFYTEFLSAFPDVKFRLTDIVIGPQGAFEVAEMTATHLGEWEGRAPTARPVRGQVLILFPWNRTVGKFAGERIFVDPASFVR